MASLENPSLLEQIDLLDGILAASTDCIYVFDRAGRYLYASPAGLAAFGLQASDVLGKNWRELNLPTAGMEPHDIQRKLVFRTGIPIEGETRFPSLQGIRYYKYLIGPWLGKDGEIQAVIQTHRDLTEQKQLEEALRLWTEELEARVLARTQALVNLNESLQLEIAEHQKAEQNSRLHQEQAIHSEVENLLQQLESERSRIEQVLQQMPVGVSIAGVPSGRLIYHNDEATRLLQAPLLAAETDPGYAQYGALHANGQPYQPEEYPIARSRLSGEIVKAEEMQYRRSDGTVTWLSVSAAPILDRNGQIVATVSTFEDIADRKRTEQTLAKELLRIQTLFDTSFDGIVILDAGGNVLEANPRFAEMLGYTLEETKKLTVFDWEAQFPKEQLLQLMDETIIRKRGVLETRHRRRDRSLYDVEISYNTTEWEGEILRFCVCRDISDRKKSEQALQEREALLRLFAQYAPVGIAMFDRNMRYVMSSQRWVDDYYLDSIDALVGRSHYEVFPELPDELRQIHQRCLAGAIAKGDDDLFVRADGTHQWLRWEVHPWHTARGEIGGIIIFSEDITHRKQAQLAILQLNQELQQKVTELQTLLDVIPIPIGIAEDPKCRSIRVNPALAELLNIPPTANASLSAPETERPTSFKVYRNGQEMAPEELPLQYAAAYGLDVRDLEVEVVWQDGTTVTLLEYAAPLFDEQGRPRGSVGAFLNITERKQAEKALRENEQQLRLALQAAKAGAWTWELKSNQVYWSDEYYQLLGLKPGSLKATYENGFSRLHPEDREWVETEIATAIQQGKDTHIEHRILLPDGTFRWIVGLGQMFYDESNQPARMAGIAVDITERKQTEAALYESQERYRTLVQNFPDGGVFLFDRDLRYVLAEGQGLAEIGINRSFMEGKTLWEVFDRDTCRLLEPWYRETLAGNSHMTEIPFADRIYRTYFLPLSDGRGSVKLGMVMFQNITLQKQAEQTLRNARDELERQVQERTCELQQLTDELTRSNRELEQFAYIASHDLQEPLRAVTSFTQMLAKRYRGHLDAKAETYIEFIVDGAARMQQLIKDLLAYSRVGRAELKLQLVDFNALLERVKKDLHVAIAETQAVITADSLPILTADPSRMATLLQNLISNSLKYRSEAPPTIHISVKSLMPNLVKNSTIEGSSLIEPLQSWIFSVQDNGIGIEPQYAERIFGIFQRLHTSDEYPGTGLGLAICQKIIEQHHGKIWVESHLREGATFFFTIPKTINTEHDIPHPPSITQHPPG